MVNDVTELGAQARTNPLLDASGLDIGALIVRVGVGVVFSGHGLQKFGAFDNGSYPNSISAQKDLLRLFGYSSVGLLAWVVTLAELIAGVSLILGAITPLGAAAAIGITLQFIAGPQWDAGMFGNANAGGFEFTWAFFVVAIALAFIGPGRLSVDAALGYRLEGRRWGLLALAVGVITGIIVLQVWGVGLGGTPSPPGF
jgi:putative oxidoreductase